MGLRETIRKMVLINAIKARQIFDSRGNPTVEVDLTTNLGTFRAAVPSGASTGIYEALELRDKEKTNWLGKGCKTACNNVNNVIAELFVGKEIDITNQRAVDQIMLEADGTPNKSKLGANAILGVSLAVARAAAAEKNVPLFQHLADIASNQRTILPVPAFNVINGGSHAGNKLAMQEFMLLPYGVDTFSAAMKAGSEIYQNLKNVIKKKYGQDATNVGAEGGFAPNILANTDALDLVVEAIEIAGYTGKVGICMDVAASEFWVDECKKYDLDFKSPAGDFNDKSRYVTPFELGDLYRSFIEKYPIVSIEDPFDQDDWEGYTAFTASVGSSTQVVGDDLLVTNPKRIQTGIDKVACNALLLKVNQIGTLTESIQACKLAQSSGWGVMVSHRSGETEDTFIADLVVGLCAGQIKTGAPCRSERLAKYNQLLRIEEELGPRAVYDGKFFRTPKAALPPYKIVLVRHGESQWNKLNKFCGWFDADLSPQGIAEAKFAGEQLREKGFRFDVAFTSVLQRAIKTLFHIQESLDAHWIPVNRHWRLNERMYGALQGLNKAETAAKHGEKQVKVWRRAYDIPPPAMDKSSPMYPGNDVKYKDLKPEEIPATECLKDTVDRFLPYWHEVIAPTVKSGQRVIIAAHGNSLRALVKFLDDIPDEEITELNIPTGIPLVYELDKDLRPIRHYYMASDEQVAEAVNVVANQGKAK